MAVLTYQKFYEDLLTRPSLPVWAHTPELSFLQFPWRLCALLAPILALFLALLLSRQAPVHRDLPVPGEAEGSASPRCLLSSLAVAVVLILPAWHLFHKTCDLEDSVASRVALFHSPLGTDATDEYTPIDADPDQLHPHDPPFWLIPAFDEAFPSPCALPCTRQPPRLASVNGPAPASARPGQAPSHLALTLQHPAYLVLNRRAYPLWRILRNGTAVDPNHLPPRDDGLIAILLPAGPSTIDLRPAPSRDRTLGLALSILALVLFLLLARTSQGRRASIPAPTR